MNKAECDLVLLMRKADPAVTPKDGPLTEAQRAIGRRIMCSKAASGQVREPRAWVRQSRGPLIALAAGVLALVLMLGVGIAQPTRASAVTPPPLTFHQTGMTKEELQTLIASRLALAPGRATPQRSAEFSGWYIQIGEDQRSRPMRTAISPQNTKFSWKEDGSGRIVVTAGQAYWADGSKEQVSDTSVPKPGTIIENLTLRPGEVGVPIRVPGDTSGELWTYMVDAGTPVKPTGFDVMEGIDTLLTSWTLTNRQEFVLAQLLLSSGDVQVAGETADRRGRRAVGVDAHARGFESIVLFSASTGRIIAIEVTSTVRRGAIPIGGTMSYTLWEDVK